jgi:ribonuclease BN (tRNA processing enzyme)
MELTILGNDGTYPRAGGACSSYLLQEGEHLIVLDMGNGSLANLQKVCDLREIDAVVLSHLHFDHFADIIPLRYALETMKSRKDFIRPLAVYLPKPALWLSQELMMHEIFDLHFIEDEPLVKEGPFALSFAEVVHSVRSYAVKVEVGDKSLVYSGDSAYCEALVNLARKSDLLVCEASFAGEQENLCSHHQSASSAGMTASQADVGRLLLTHLSQGFDVDELLSEASYHFPHVEVSSILAKYHV